MENDKEAKRRIKEEKGPSDILDIDDIVLSFANKVFIYGQKLMEGQKLDHLSTINITAIEIRRLE